MKTYENFINKPIIKYYDNGQKKSEEWFLDWKRHREDGPAYQIWSENGQKRIEEWFLNNRLHRENGPSYQVWYDNGQKKSEIWSLNNKYHREDGPVYQYWSENGQKKSEYWSLNDKEYSRKKWINKLKEIGSPHYDEQRMLLNAEKYNI
jgi:hypothetical protein